MSSGANTGGAPPTDATGTGNPVLTTKLAKTKRKCTLNKQNLTLKKD